MQLSARVVRELLRRTEQAQKLIEGVSFTMSAASGPTTGASQVNLDDAKLHLEHVRLTLCGAISSDELLAGLPVGKAR